MKSWMDDNQVGDNIQLAIQSQAIQTALERNNTSLSDGAFQSFLTNAPTPRFYNSTISGGLLGAGASGVMVWGSTIYVDPYGMLVPSTGLITIPVDGWYVLTCNASFLAGVSGTAQIQLKNNTTGGVLANILHPGASSGNFQVMFSTCLPHRQGTILSFTLGNLSPSAIVGYDTNTHISGSWVSPFNNYQSGGAQ